MQQDNVKELVKSLPEVIREDVNNSLGVMLDLFDGERYYGAKKMADILIRFYLRHHLKLEV
ncbi:MAG: hypothetical protein ACE5JP_15930 [Candidatus Bipolaricaulia bacterium]